MPLRAQYTQSTHSPDASKRADETGRDHHRPDTPCTLEDHATQRAGSHRVGGIVLPAELADQRVDAVVRNSHSSSGIAQERPPPRHGVEYRIEPQLGRLTRRAPQTLLQTPGASNRQTGEVCDTRPVAEIVCEAARGEDGLRAG